MVQGREEKKALKEARDIRISAWEDITKRVKKCREQNPNLKYSLMATRFNLNRYTVMQILNNEMPKWYKNEMEKRKKEKVNHERS